MHYALYTINILYTLCSILYTVYSILCSLYPMPYTLYSALCCLWSIIYSVCPMLCALCPIKGITPRFYPPCCWLVALSPLIEHAEWGCCVALAVCFFADRVCHAANHPALMTHILLLYVSFSLHSGHLMLRLSWAWIMNILMFSSVFLANANVNATTNANANANA